MNPSWSAPGSEDPDDGYDLTPRQAGTLRRQIIRVLDGANRPVTAKAIAETVDATPVAIGKTLAYLKREGLAAQTQKGNGAPWYAGDGLMRAVGQAFPVLIAWYMRVDPKLVTVLERDYKTWRFGGHGQGGFHGPLPNVADKED